MQEYFEDMEPDFDDFVPVSTDDEGDGFYGTDDDDCSPDSGDDDDHPGHDEDEPPSTWLFDECPDPDEFVPVTTDDETDEENEEEEKNIVVPLYYDSDDEKAGEEFSPEQVELYRRILDKNN